MIDVIVQRKGKAYYPFSEEDAVKGFEYPENMPLKAKITGARKVRSYLELCCYKGSCRYIANLDLSENTNTEKKIDHLTKIQCGFVDDTVYDPNTKRVHWIVKSLSYDTCDQTESHNFIKLALERHAELAGMKNADKYVAMLNELGNK